MEHDVDAAMNDATAARGHSPDESASCSCSTAMSIETTPATTAGMTGDSRDELESLDRAYELGVDAEGAVHHHSPYDNRVVVVDERGDIEATFDTADRRLAAYVAFVDDSRGWADLNYKASYADILAEAISA